MNHAAKEICVWPVERLIAYERNSRTHSPEQVKLLAESIEAFGFTQPILVDGTDTIIAGHGRLLAAQKLGLKDVPVIVITHLSDAQRRAYIIADNKIALDAGWDLEMLESEIAALDEDQFDLELLGFSDDEMADMAPSEQEEEPETKKPTKVIPAEPEKKTAASALYKSGPQPEVQHETMTFFLHKHQADCVRQALESAKAMGEFVDQHNESSDGNALARICEMFEG